MHDEGHNLELQDLVASQNRPLHRREVWILCPVINSQEGLCTNYTKVKLQYTNQDCLYSKEWS